MKSLWNDQEAGEFLNDPVALRAYTSRLLGAEPSLVQHGGGNTSVKHTVTNLFGEDDETLFVKGSGWDLATILPQGFSPVKMDTLLKLASLEKLSDSDMVTEQKKALLNPSAPNPSVEAILHAIIPFKYVDHTHSDAVVTLTNSPGGEEKVKELYGDKVLVLPYVMPGFVLARQVFEATRDLDWSKLEGIILLHHGVFSFHDDAKVSYERMISIVDKAEDYLKNSGAADKLAQGKNTNPDLLKMAKLRKEVSDVAGKALIARLNTSDEAVGFSNLDKAKTAGAKGTITPDHSIHTKPWPMFIEDDTSSSLEAFTTRYKNYYEAHKTEDHTMLNSAPCWAIWPGQGLVSFGQDSKRARVISDITSHNIRAVQWAEALGEWQPLPESELFDVEYWELEQAKLKKAKGAGPALQGKVAIVTGAASGIGQATAENLMANGACVVALDINPEVEKMFTGDLGLGVTTDVTNIQALENAVEKAVTTFGGIDILVNNAGMFPKGSHIEELSLEGWQKSMDLNLTSHFQILKMCIPFLKMGFDPTVVFVASKNVLAPGPGAAAYSTAKAGLTQLARVAALELAPFGIRVNTIHPDAVFDTAIWTDEILENRAKHYGMTVDQYKRKNLLKAEIKSSDVADMIGQLASSKFLKTTGAQIPIDGGSDRII